MEGHVISDSISQDWRKSLTFRTFGNRELPAKGIRSLYINKAPMSNGSNTGTNRYTDSNENDDTDAILPVPKNPVCNNTKKNNAIRASERASFRNDGFVLTTCPFAPPLTRVSGVSVVVVAILVSSSLQSTRVVKKVT